MEYFLLARPSIDSPASSVAVVAAAVAGAESFEMKLALENNFAVKGN